MLIHLWATSKQISNELIICWCFCSTNEISVHLLLFLLLFFSPSAVTAFWHFPDDYPHNECHMLFQQTWMKIPLNIYEYWVYCIECMQGSWIFIGLTNKMGVCIYRNTNIDTKSITFMLHALLFWEFVVSFFNGITHNISFN